MGLAKSRAETESSRGYGSSEKTLCPDHVDDTALKSLISDYATEASCSYCERSGTEDDPVAASFEDFMPLFMVGVRHFYARAADEGVLRDDGEYVGANTYGSEEVAEDIFYAALGDHPGIAQDRLLEDIRAALLPDDWVRTNWLWPTSAERLSDGWKAFKELVKHRTRFLFIRWPEPHSYYRGEMSPGELFDSLVELLNNLPELVVDLDGPLYRGRMYLEEPDLSKIEANGLGAAPISKAASNRMSPAGISMFYGADDIDTAIAEVGAHSSHSWAVVAQFTAPESIRVIDLSSLPALPSIFDPDETSRSRYEAVSFLCDFVKGWRPDSGVNGRAQVLASVGDVTR